MTVFGQPTRPAAGWVRQLRVESVEDTAFGGACFGDIGGYRLVKARAFCELDPWHPLNQPIVGLEHAPRNPAGWVEYDVDVCALHPSDPDRSNGWLLFEIPNRGNKLVLSRMNDAIAKNTPSRPEDAGDGLLMRHGFTLAWSAWQGDVPPGNDRLLARLPRGGRGVRGVAREEFIPEPSLTNESIVRLPDRRFTATLTYPAATLDPAEASLTVRARPFDPRLRPEGLAWHFVDASHIEVRCPPGMDEGAIYEFIYAACDPIVMGTGLAGIRDFVSFLRHAPGDGQGNPNPLGPLRERLRYAACFGASQSGRVLRDFLYEGFNADGMGRPVFDAMLPVVTGARRAFVNAPFAQPGRFSRQHEDQSFPGDQFPFAYATSHDPISGRTDGILERAQDAGVVPKILHLDTETEFWAGRGSLLVTDTQGHDLSLPDAVRVYMATGLPHATYAPPRGLTPYEHNALAYHRPLRALLMALVEWVERGVPPPASAFPSRREGTLVDLDVARLQFPAIPGLRYPRQLNELRLLDHSVQPPRAGAAYPVHVAATDRDGNGLGGIRDPLLTAPIATLTGWMPRAPGYAEGDLYSITGAVFPFPADAVARAAQGDPRMSLEERYGSLDGWIEAFGRACDALVAQRLLLPEDAKGLSDRARRGWLIRNFC